MVQKLDMKNKWMIPIRKKIRIGAVTFIFLLIGLMGLIGFILWRNYDSQLMLHQSAIKKLRYDLEKQASAAGYFFSERKRDLSDLADSHELRIFFESKALGMSMKYGLTASLHLISDKFEHLMTHKTFRQNKIYSRIVFVDSSGKVLVDCKDKKSIETDERNWKNYLNPDKTGPFIITEHDGPMLRVMVSTPYFFKDRYAGQIIGTVSTQYPAEHNIPMEDGFLKRIDGIVCRHDIFHIQAKRGFGPGAFDMESFRDKGISSPFRFQMTADDGTIEKMLFIQARIEETPFLLASIIPEVEVFGPKLPWHLPLSMGFFSVLVVGMLFRLWQANGKNIALSVRVDEATDRNLEIEEKNQQLKAEILERKRAEAALRLNEEKYRSIFESLQDVYFRTDMKGNITTISPSVFKETGYRPEELIGRQAFEFYNNSIKRKLFLETLEAQNVVEDLELKLRTKDGALIDILIRAHWVFNQEQNPAGVEGTFRNISNRKRAEEELTRYKEELELIVKDRTRELESAHKELVKKALEAGRAQLSAMVLHNIGNAITPVGVYVEGMKSDDLESIAGYLEKSYKDLCGHMEDLQRYVNEDPRGKEIFSFIGKLTDRLIEYMCQSKKAVQDIDSAVSYISDILTLQQSYAARESETKELVALNHVLEDAVRMHENSLKKRGVFVKKDFADNLPELAIDKNRLIQVIVNLIKNSYEALGALNDNEKRKTITIRSFCNGEEFGFDVNDNGVGIAPEDTEKIMEFGRSLKGSSGFGIYYCKAFIESNKGKIHINSPGVGKGTTVSVTFETENADSEMDFPKLTMS